MPAGSGRTPPQRQADQATLFTGHLSATTFAQVQIAEVARRSGVPATTLRHYKGIGLLSVRRGANGYRDQNADASTRLNLIEAREELGLSLDEVAGHLGVMGTGSYTEVGDHLHPLLVEQVVRLEAERVTLQQQHHRLSLAEARLAACPERSGARATECASGSGGAGRCSPGTLRRPRRTVDAFSCRVSSSPLVPKTLFDLHELALTLPLEPGPGSNHRTLAEAAKSTTRRKR